MKILYVIGIVILFMYTILEIYICLNHKMDADNIFALITRVICLYSLIMVIKKDLKW